MSDNQKTAGLSLRGRFIALALLTSLVPITIIAILSIVSSTDALQRTLAKELANKSKMTGRQIDGYFKQRIADIRVISRARELHNQNRTHIKSYLNDVVKANPSIADIVLVQSSGEIFASAGKAHQDGALLTKENDKVTELFNDTLKHRANEVLLSDAIKHDGSLSVFLFTPVEDLKTQEIKAVLMIEVNMKQVNEMISVFDDSVIGDKYVYLLNDYGEVIFSRDPKQETLSLFNDAKVHEDLLTDTDIDGAKGHIIYTDFYGDNVMAGMADMQAHGINNALDWGIIAVAPMKEIAAPAAALRNKIFWLAFIVLILASLAATFSARGVVKDTGHLVQIMNQLALGDLNDATEIKRQDEIGILAQAVTNLVHHLRERAELSTTIAAGDLSRSVTVLSDKDDLGIALNKMVENLREMISSLEKSRDEAEKANEAKSSFLANMSHEIRTPMNAILGFTEILINKEKDKHKKAKLENISAAGNALLRLINDILDLSRVEAGKIELQYQSVTLSSLFNDLKVMFELKSKDKHLDFILELDEDLPKYLVLDETRLRQVVMNLCGNAIKFTDKGFVKLKAELIPNSNESLASLRVSVEDTGKGIPKDQQEKIFEAFEQSRGQKVSEYGGTGLGLAISRKLASLMKGDLRLEDKEGPGSLFVVDLPDLEITNLSSTTENEDISFDHSQIRFEEATILLADDIDYNREIVINFLEDYPFNIIEAKDGLEAMEHIKNQKIDLLLLDMKMPNMDGYEVAQTLKADENYKDIPIVTVTASALKRDEEFIKSFCDSYIRKPVTKTTLVTALCKFLSYQQEETSENVTEDNQELPKEKNDERLIERINIDLSVFQDLDSTSAINEWREMLDILEHIVSTFANEEIEAIYERLNDAFNIFDLNSAEKELKLIYKLKPSNSNSGDE